MGDKQLEEKIDRIQLDTDKKLADIRSKIGELHKYVSQLNQNHIDYLNRHHD